MDIAYISVGAAINARRRLDLLAEQGDHTGEWVIYIPDNDGVLVRVKGNITYPDLTWLEGFFAAVA